MFDRDWRDRDCLTSSGEKTLTDEIIPTPGKAQDLTIFVKVTNPSCATDRGLAPSTLEKTFRIIIPAGARIRDAVIEYPGEQEFPVGKRIPVP